MMRRFLAAALLVLAAPIAAHAGLSQADIAEAGLNPAPGATLPADLPLKEADGRPQTLGVLLAGKPSLVLFVDYTCTTLCAATVDALGAALANVAYREDADYRVLVIGFNPADGPREAAAFRDAHFGASAFARKTHFLVGSPGAIARLSRAVGLRVVYDAQYRQFAHPLDMLLVAPGGRLERVLNPLAVTPFDLRLALAETDVGQLASPADRVALLCYGWDPLSGIHTLAITRILTAACLATMFLLGGAIVFWLRRERREAAR
jgi:protein SCO1/2